jgi:hypothetical protein
MKEEQVKIIWTLFNTSLIMALIFISIVGFFKETGLVGGIIWTCIIIIYLYGKVKELK